jgi:hypothetical protein
MSGKKPFFLTGANAKIVVNNKTLAFATNVSYQVIVNHASPIVLGMYEATSIEPLSYNVSGQFSVIRYVADVKNTGINNVADSSTGNGIGNWKSFSSPSGQPGKYAADGRANESLNPGRLDQAVGFEIQIFQGSTSVARIRNARIVQAAFSVGVDALAQQTFSFQAIYADEDSFLADFSGRGQQFN